MYAVVVLPLVPYRRGRESEADDIAQLSLTKIQFSSRKSWLYTPEELLSSQSADGLISSATCGLTVFHNGCLAMLIFGIRRRNIQNNTKYYRPNKNILINKIIDQTTRYM